jgi:hypothetical protein
MYLHKTEKKKCTNINSVKNQVFVLTIGIRLKYLLKTTNFLLHKEYCTVRVRDILYLTAEKFLKW